MHNVLSDKPEIEYLDGEAFPTVGPQRTHTLVARFLMAILERCASDRGEFGPEWRFSQSRADQSASEFVPDIAFRSPSQRAGLLARKDRNGARTCTVDQPFTHAALPWLEFEVKEIFPKPRRREHSA